MKDSCISLRCDACGRWFSVQLSGMRLNLSPVCPCCGREYSISGEQALKAQRALERLERTKSSGGAGRVRLDLLAPWAPEGGRTEEWPEEGDWCGGANTGWPWLRGF